MKCEWVQENILLYVYNELADDARYELEQHLGRCPVCAGELKSARAFHSTLSQLPVQEPTPNLLAASRMRLQEGLETAPQGGFWQRLTFDPANWLRQVRFSPALAAVIFMIGFGGGIGAMYKMTPADRGPIGVIIDKPAAVPQEASITGIRSVIQEPGSDRVNIKYDTVQTQEATGNLNDQRIQQLLLFAARNNYSSGVRMDSVDLLTQKPDDTRVREALMYSLQNDTNPGVRLKAIEGLGSYVKDDTRVRDVVLNALMADKNQGVRTQALLLLGPVKADSSVRAALQTLAATDQNQYIRSQARTVLAQLPEID
ncbi:MAG TPA: HEAT repeat domain-containing protein [Terriglobales bacterium]|nr:HEAT repeat domain-containing protein [Terriglobales bacterium]